jgi:S-adenosylmethionine:tRNA ribosyltransferase-isomerase
MRTSDFDYSLPPELIAQTPAEPRDSARMLVLARATGTLSHHAVRDLPDFLQTGDLLVLNNTRVISARLRGKKSETGGQVEVFLLEPAGEENVWEALVRARRRPRPGDRLLLGSGPAAAVFLEDGELGRARVRLESPVPVSELMETEGETPLPPYIRRAGGATPSDRARYQTVYAKEPGAVAAPTAGLHFTEPLLERLGERGVGRAELTLHVGLGTFRPVAVEDPGQHRMESERFILPSDTVERIRQTRAAGRRVVAVGTTTVRTLETAATRPEGLEAGSGRSTLFIRPPYSFRVVDALLTNFHLPRSTLLMLVSAFAGTERIRRAYAEAVRERYRFFSYGDSMLIL